MKAYEFSWDKMLEKGYEFPDAKPSEDESKPKSAKVVTPTSKKAPGQKTDALLSPEDTSFQTVIKKKQKKENTQETQLKWPDDFIGVPSQPAKNNLELKEPDAPLTTIVDPSEIAEEDKETVSNFERSIQESIADRRIQKAAPPEKVDEPEVKTPVSEAGSAEAGVVEAGNPGKKSVTRSTIIVARGKDKNARPINVTRIGRSGHLGRGSEERTPKRTGTLSLSLGGTDSNRTPLAQSGDETKKSAVGTFFNEINRLNETPSPQKKSGAQESTKEPTVSTAEKNRETSTEPHEKHRVLIAAENLAALLMSTDLDALEDRDAFAIQAKAAIQELGRAKASIEIGLLKKGFSVI